MFRDFPRASIRRLLDQVIKTDVELDAFCLDYFPHVQKQFGTGFSRVQKVNLLLEVENTPRIYQELQNFSASVSGRAFPGFSKKRQRIGAVSLLIVVAFMLYKYQFRNLSKQVIDGDINVKPIIAKLIPLVNTDKIVGYEFIIDNRLSRPIFINELIVGMGTGRYFQCLCREVNGCHLKVDYDIILKPVAGSRKIVSLKGVSKERVDDLAYAATGKFSYTNSCKEGQQSWKLDFRMPIGALASAHDQSQIRLIFSVSPSNSVISNDISFPFPDCVPRTWLDVTIQYDHDKTMNSFFDDDRRIVGHEEKNKYVKDLLIDDMLNNMIIQLADSLKMNSRIQPFSKRECPWPDAYRWHAR